MGDDGLSEKMRESLKNLRQGMLKLHKLLLDTERIGFERARGKINNSYEFLQLALKDPWFDWLHRLSELIVEVDEMLDTLDSEKAATEEDGKALIDRVRQLLSPSESGSEFQRNYFLALQQSPDVVLLHSELMKLLP
ncbi:MAG TPA: hypothetical protein VIR01_09600 [Pyrinomonadaceae bacterium]|jgi:hypothetical protein